jgi:hypothetical protein
MSVSWQKLLNENLLARHKTSKLELDTLRVMVDRNLHDANLQGLSTDNRFGLVYEAVLLMAKMAISCAGYRVKGQGAHKTTFMALPLAMGSGLFETAEYFDRCRRKRNELSYDAAGVIAHSDAEQLMMEATGFRDRVEAWIAERYPHFKT